MKKLVGLLIVTVLISGCSEDILNIENPNALTQNDYYTTVDHAHQAVVACYDALKGNGLYGLRLPWMSIAMGDFGVYEKPSYEEMIYTVDSEDVKFIWGYAYRGVAKSNLALEKIEQIKDPLLTEDLRRRLMGEVKFLRALYNFILHTRYYEAPLITTVITDMQATFGNSTWADFLEQIEKDILGYENVSGEFIPGAVDLLPVSYGSEDAGRATMGAAYALLGKTYLYHEDWEKAREYFLKVTELEGIYELTQAQGTDSTDYIYAYLSNFSSEDLVHKGRYYKAENNKECIFSIQFASTEFVRNQYLPGWMTDGTVLSAYNGINGWRNTSASAEFVALFEATNGHPSGCKRDPRLYGSVYVPGDTITPKKDSPYYVPFNPKAHLLSHINTGYGIKKYLYPLHESIAAPFNAPQDWRLLRYSEVLLMLAEAEFHLNGSSNLALDCINRIRVRVGLEPVTEVTAAVIVQERACELGLEAERFWDLVRWGRIGGEWPSPENFIPGFVIGKHEFLPIPTYDLTKMQGKLIQNPGW